MTFQRKDDLERRLREARRLPRADFVESLAERVDARPKSFRPQAWRLVFAGGLSAALLVALASVGGLSYAATSSWHAVRAAANVVDAKPAPNAVSSAAAQYGKEQVCHKGHTITISKNAEKAHLNHGDTLGPCPTGAVKGAQATRTSGGPSGGVLGATAGNDPLSATGSGNLPFTGASLGLALAVGLFLLTTGIALRMRARRN